SSRFVGRIRNLLPSHNEEEMGMTVADLLSFARTIEGQELRTLTGSSVFRVEVDEDQLVYRSTKGSAATPRRESRISLAETVALFTHTRSLLPAHYKHFSINAAYTLVLIQLYIQAGLYRG